MRIWGDLSAPAHVLVLRPIIERLRERGHQVVVTSRDYTQIQELLALDGWSIRRSRRRPGGPASR
jgi:predicted glycosyltransferase